MSDDRPRRSGVVDAVLSILEALAERDFDDRDRTRSAGGSPIDVDYDVSVGSIADRPSGSPGAPRSSGSARTPEGSEPTDVHATVRETETGYQFVADLPAETSGEAVTADVEEGAIALYADGERIERVPVSFEDVRATDVTVTNRVVEVTLERTEGTP